MAKTITALFENYADANNAVQDLENHGFLRADISTMAHEALADDVRVYEDDTSGAATGAGVGAAVGGVGGLILGLSALAIPGVGPVLAAGPIAAALIGAGVGAATGGLIGALADMGVPEEEAHYYAEGVRRGSVLVTVQTTDDLAERAASVLSKHHPLDIDKRISEWRQSGWSRFDHNAEPYKALDSKERKNRPAFLQPEHAPTPDKANGSKAHTVVTAAHQTMEPARTPTHATAKETTIPVVEEELQVGKRQTERDVQVHTTVTQTPVQEQVRLREEHVTVERRPVDRPARPGDGEAFKEKTITVTETSEEPVVSKQARVVEEVVVRKDATEHTETVRDTVRRTDVSVDQSGTAMQEGIKGFETYDADFRRHYGATFVNKSGATYEIYLPAYRYGYTFATDKRYMDRDWTVIEPEARRTWEERHAGTWEQFKDAIRYARDKVLGRR